MLNFPSSPVVNQLYQSWAWDGAKWGPAKWGSVASVNVANPISGAVIVLTDLQPVFINNAGTLASLTFRLPEGNSDNSIEISFLSPVTTLHIQDSLGANVPTAPISAYGPGAGLVFRYVDPSVKWVLWK